MAPKVLAVVITVKHWAWFLGRLFALWGLPRKVSWPIIKHGVSFN
ncbi:hypothetical protein ES703_81943 [subsurface metagenome]